MLDEPGKPCVCNDLPDETEMVARVSINGGSHDSESAANRVSEKLLSN